MPDKLDITFERFWPDLEERFKMISSIVESQPVVRKDRELIEEILETTRSLSRHIITKESEPSGVEKLWQAPEFLKWLEETGKFYKTMPKEDLERIRRFGALD